MKRLIASLLSLTMITSLVACSDSSSSSDSGPSSEAETTTTTAATPDTSEESTTTTAKPILKPEEIVPAIPENPDHQGTLEDAENISWAIKDGQLIIWGEGRMPDFYDDYLGAYPFRVTKAPWAEYADEFSYVGVMEGITSIGRNSFCGLTNLEYVKLPETLEEIGVWGFYCTGLESIKIPDSCRFISREAFAHSDNLSVVDLGNGVETIEYMAFMECKKLSEVHIPASVEIIEGGAFEETSGLKTITVDENSEYFTVYDDALYSKDMTVMHQHPAARNESKLTVPEGVEKIMQGAIPYNTHLKTVHLPSTVKSFEEYFISTWYDNLMVTVDEQNPNIMIDEKGVIYSKDMSELIYCTRNIDAQTYTVHEDTKVIGAQAFNNQSTVSEIVLPDGLESIMDLAFFATQNLRKVNIPDSVTYVSEQAFESTTLLKLAYKGGSYSISEFFEAFE